MEGGDKVVLTLTPPFGWGLSLWFWPESCLGTCPRTSGQRGWDLKLPPSCIVPPHPPGGKVPCHVPALPLCQAILGCSLCHLIPDSLCTSPHFLDGRGGCQSRTGHSWPVFRSEEYMGLPATQISCPTPRLPSEVGREHADHHGYPQSKARARPFS